MAPKGICNNNNSEYELSSVDVEDMQWFHSEMLARMHLSTNAGQWHALKSAMTTDL